MQILIDAIAMSHPQPGGYRTYTTNLVQHLQRIEQKHEYIVAVDRPIPWTPRPGWELRVIGRRGSIGVIWREQYAVPRAAVHAGAALIHAPAATASLWASPPLLLTLHDTIEFSEPLPSPKQTKRWAMRQYSRFAQRHAAHHARHIITVSRFSKEQIARFFSVPNERITVIHNASSPVFCPLRHEQAKEEVRKRWSVSEPVLGMASAAKRKNLGALLAAYALLPDGVQRQHPLALVCTHPEVKSQMSALAEKNGVSDHVLLLENVGDADLASLYNAAAVFVFPSLEEGFGLPPLEAMACGTPVVASNTSSIPEVVDDAGLLVPPTDVAQIAEAINRVLTSPGLADELRTRGLARSAAFSWLKVAQQTTAVYERSLQG